MPLPSFQKQRFEQAVHAYSRDLFRYMFWVCRDRAQAEDLVQETFARAWSAWEDQADEKAVRAWLFTIARREHARLFEKKRPEPDPEADLEALFAPAHDPGLAIDLGRAMASLPLAYRDCLLLQVLGGLSCAEIAAASDATEEAIHARVSRARKALRAWLDGDRPADRNTQRNPR